MLSGTEKFKLARELKSSRGSMRTAVGIEKFRIAKQIREIRAKITGKNTGNKKRLQALLDGQYNSRAPKDFIALVRDIVEKDGARVEEVKTSVALYADSSLERLAA